MKKICIIFLNLFLVFEFCSVQEICKENNGNIQIKEAFIHMKNVFLITEKDQTYRLDSLNWDGNQFRAANIETVDTTKWGINGLNLTFPIQYPSLEGPYLDRLVFIKWERVLSIDQWVGYTYELDQKGTLLSKEPLNVNVYKCGSMPEPLRLCSLLAKFPESDRHKQFLSMSTFPKPFDLLPNRFFVYYTETPPIGQKKVCPGCYKSKRYVFIGTHITIARNDVQMDWNIDDTTGIKCDDLNGRIVNASTALTPYNKNGDKYQFQWIEFFGTKFTLYQVSITKEKFDDMKELKTGPIGSIFGCPQSTTEMGSEEESKSKVFPVLLILLILLIAIILIVAIIWFILSRKRNSPPPNVEEPSAPKTQSKASELKSDSTNSKTDNPGDNSEQK